MVSLYLPFCYTYKEVTGLRAYSAFRMRTQHICKVSIFFFSVYDYLSIYLLGLLSFLLEAFGRL